MGKNNSREYRGNIADYNNMLLRETRLDNRLDDEKFQGHGFPGHFQFIPYLGRAPIRPGEKRERDMQGNTLAFENARQLNTSAMGRAKFLFTNMPSAEERNAHDAALDHMRSMRSYARGHERQENGHGHARNEL